MYVNIYIFYVNVNFRKILNHPHFSIFPGKLHNYVFTYLFKIIIISYMSDSSVIVSNDVKEYRCRRPQYNPYYQCIEDNCETFERVYSALIVFA